MQTASTSSFLLPISGLLEAVHQYVWSYFTMSNRLRCLSRRNPEAQLLRFGRLDIRDRFSFTGLRIPAEVPCFFSRYIESLLCLIFPRVSGSEKLTCNSLDFFFLGTELCNLFFVFASSLATSPQTTTSHGRNTREDVCLGYCLDRLGNLGYCSTILLSTN